MADDLKWPAPDQIINEPPPLPEHLKLSGGVATRQVVLTLAYSPIPHAYTVRSIQNSAWYRPGDWISHDVVKQICANPGWDTTMVEFHMELPNLPNIPLPIP